MYLNDLLNNKNIKVTTIYQSATWNLGVSNNTIIEYEENGETKQIIIDETKLSEPEKISLLFFVKRVTNDKGAIIKTVTDQELITMQENIKNQIPGEDEKVDLPEPEGINPVEPIEEPKAEELDANDESQDDLEPIELMPPYTEPEPEPEPTPEPTPEPEPIPEPEPTPEPELTPVPVAVGEASTGDHSIKGLKITGIAVALALAATGVIAVVNGFKGRNTGSTTVSTTDDTTVGSINALVSNIEVDEHLFDPMDPVALSSVAGEVYIDLNDQTAVVMTTPNTTEAAKSPKDKVLGVDPSAIIDGTNKIDTAKLARFYNITKSDVLIMTLVANGIDPYSYGYTEDQIMNAIKSGPVQAAHAGGTESIAGAIDNSEYNPYLLESVNKELLPTIFADKYDREFVAHMASDKKNIIDAAYSGKRVSTVKKTTEKAFEDVVKYLVLSESFNYSDSSQGCLESVNPFAQYVALSYGMAVTSVASVMEISITHKGQKYTPESAIATLGIKVDNCTDTLGQMYQSPCATEKVKVKN